MEAGAIGRIISVVVRVGGARGVDYGFAVTSEISVGFDSDCAMAVRDELSRLNHERECVRNC